MHIEFLSKSNKTKLDMWKLFLKKADLEPDEQAEKTILLWDDNTLVATGSRDGNLLKCIAVDNNRQGEGLTASVITALRQDAFSDGINHLFLYTKPQNEIMFSDLFFYPVAKTDKVLLMENKKDGINCFLNELCTKEHKEKSGCIVLNCNPFTLGHRYLIESALKYCEHLYIFVVSEDKSFFSANDRLEMVKLGIKDLSGVTVLPTGPYLISSSTFPSYFLKERGLIGEIQCLLDIEIFAKYYAPKFNITTRFVGTEPFCEITKLYNETLKKFLPEYNIYLEEIPRLEISGKPVSATRVRELIACRDKKGIKSMVPDTTYDYLISRDLI